MITLRTLKWSNWFSYGANNQLTFDTDTVTQILGVVGAGKTSIPIIIQEVLYGKNNKGFKKAELANREINEPISAELTFTKNDTEYVVMLKRGSSLKLSVARDGEDLSAHTSAGTYKVIEAIIGIDFKLFCQLTYQSSKNSLEFLTASDTQRKKFLISLFNLDLYIKYHEGYKNIVKDVISDVSKLQGSISTIEGWMRRNPNTEYIELEKIQVPPEPVSESARLEELEEQLRNIISKNREITKNLEYLQMRSAINPELLVPLANKQKESHDLVIEKSKMDQRLESLNSDIKKIEELKGQCPTCKQQIPEEFKDELLALCTTTKDELTDNIDDVTGKLKSVQSKNKTFLLHKKNIEEFERLTNLISNDIPTELLDKEVLATDIKELKSTIEIVLDNLENAKQSNILIDEKNTKSKFLFEEWSKLEKELSAKTTKLTNISDLLYDIEVLRDLFGTSGLVSYKIQYLVQDLQNEITKYLQLLSGGRFRLEFKLQEDKLNISIFDNGLETTVVALSSGQMQVVNVATLLAIRKLLSTISQTKLNILFLDECINVLDDEHKEALIDVLLEEKDLNIFIVSHSYRHPLTATIEIINSGVSRVG